MSSSRCPTGTPDASGTASVSPWRHHSSVSARSASWSSVESPSADAAPASEGSQMGGSGSSRQQRLQAGQVVGLGGELVHAHPVRLVQQRHI